jgi:hypothetical protein
MLSQLELRLAKFEALCKSKATKIFAGGSYLSIGAGFVGRAYATNVMDKVAS